MNEVFVGFRDGFCLNGPCRRGISAAIPRGIGFVGDFHTEGLNACGDIEL